MTLAFIINGPSYRPRRGTKKRWAPGILPIEIGPGHCGGSAMQSMSWLLFLPLQESRGSSDETEQELTDGQ